MGFVRAAIRQRGFLLRSQLLSNVGVSIEAIIQKEPQRGSAQVSIVLITNVVQESSIDSVMADLAQKDFVVAPAIKLRVEALGTRLEKMQ